MIDKWLLEAGPYIGPAVLLLVIILTGLAYWLIFSGAERNSLARIAAGLTTACLVAGFAYASFAW